MNVVGKKVAVIVPVYKEKLSELEQISLQQLLRVLGKYPIIFVGPDGLSIDYGKGTEDIPLVYFQKEYFTSTDSYSRLLLNPAFYRAFKEYEYILIYQLDAFVFTDRLLEFCGYGYDYWGAPVYRSLLHWRALGVRVGNGGLSLRKVSSAIRALEENKDWLGHSPFRDVLAGWEDLFWSSLGGREDCDFTCPPVNLAIQFSIQDDVCHAFKNFKKNYTFGCHGWNKPENLGRWQMLIAEAGFEQIRKEKIDTSKINLRELFVREYLFHRQGVNTNLLVGLVKKCEFAEADRLLSVWLERYPDGNAEWTGTGEAVLVVMKLCLSYDQEQKNEEIQALLTHCKLAFTRIMGAPGFELWMGEMLKALIEFAQWKSDLDAALLDRLEVVGKEIENNKLLQYVQYNLHLIEIGVNVQVAVEWFKKLLAEKIVPFELLKMIAEDATRNSSEVLETISQNPEKDGLGHGKYTEGNKEKICFITCVNDEEQFENFCLKGLKRLIVPEGISVEILTIRNAASMAAGYEEARLSSDAEYKVYLHQDLEIINENFIADILAEFRQKRQVGLIGLIGTKFLHPNCNWWDKTGDNLVGGVREIFAERSYRSLNLENKMRLEWERAEAVDGVLMATQYDVPWRSDIMDGWHFYDVSQCLEYTRAGYQIMVPRQKSLWTLHHRPAVMREGWLELWDKYRRRVMSEYTEEILPTARLNEREILLVVCDYENSENTYQEKYGYLARLMIPDGYRLSIEVVEGGCQAWFYGRSQKISRAKYKIYLDGEARIVNRHCIIELLKMFRSEKKLGAIGVEKGPLGIIDGRFVATQYDIPWDDIRYPGNLYAAEAMCLDMKRKGYQVIVAEQKEPWVQMEQRDPEETEIIRPWAEEHLRKNDIWRVGKSSRDIFMKEYGIL